MKPLCAWFLCTAALSGGPPLPAQDDPAGTGEAQVYVVPIEGTIDGSTVALAQRALRDATRVGVPWVVLEIDTPGGRMDSMYEIESLLQAMERHDVKTVSWVRHQALSAGAYLALACDETWMGPSSNIGGITPVVLGPGGIQSIGDDDARSKIISSVQARVRSLLERRGALSEDMEHLVRGLVDPRVQLTRVTWRDEDGFDQDAILTVEEARRLEQEGREILEEHPLQSPVVLTERQAVDVGLVRGTAASLEELAREHFQLPVSSIRRLEKSWSEEAGRWIVDFKPLLLLVGFVLLMVELKSPGFAVPGALGVLLLGIALFGSYLMGLAEWTEILLLIGGLGLIAVELFLVPGLLIPGVLGFLCVVLALVLSEQSFLFPKDQIQAEIMLSNLLNLSGLVIATIVVVAVLWKVLPRTFIGRMVLLDPPGVKGTGMSTQVADEEDAARLARLVGRTGVASSTLRPAGIVELDGERLDVVAEEGYVEAGSRVRILEIRGNRIVVTGEPEGAEEEA